MSFGQACLVKFYERWIKKLSQGEVFGGHLNLDRKNNWFVRQLSSHFSGKTLVRPQIILNSYAHEFIQLYSKLIEIKPSKNTCINNKKSDPNLKTNITQKRQFSMTLTKRIGKKQTWIWKSQKWLVSQYFETYFSTLERNPKISWSAFFRERG